MSGGRPTKNDAAREKKLLALAAKGVPRRVAAKAAGIAPSTLELWLKEPGFSERYTTAEADGEAKLVEAAYKKDPLWLLARRWPQRWGKKREEHKPAPPELSPALQALIAAQIPDSEEPTG